MIKRTVEISSHASHVCVRLQQLQIRRHADDGSAPIAASIPCEDIGLLVLDEPRNTFTQHALAALADAGAAVLVCGGNHLPAAMLVPLSSHGEVLTRLTLQINATRPTTKRLWQQIVRAKVLAQAMNVSRDAFLHRKLMNLRADVKSGDTTNIEAHAAKAYWAALRDLDPAWRDFRRQGQAADDPLNGMLNYGYAVMRAAVARALVAAGLLPALGLHHANRANAFALADDLLEPLRPIVDARAAQLVRQGYDQINRPVKQAMLELLTTECDCGEQAGPLMVCLHRYASSLVKCLSGDTRRLDIPEARRPERF